MNDHHFLLMLAFCAAVAFFLGLAISWLSLASARRRPRRAGFNLYTDNRPRR